jgi:hypothetical protein
LSQSREAAAAGSDSLATWVDRSALAALAVWALLESAGRLIATGRFDLDSLSDLSINLAYSASTLAALEYASSESFVYPPPFALFLSALGQLGIPAAAICWFVLISASLVGCVWLSAKLSGLAERRYGLALAVLASVGAAYCVQWDLRAANTNSLALVCLLASLRLGLSGRAGLAGALLAASAAIKLYAALWLAYLVWRRQWRWLAASLAGLVGLFALYPLIALGPQDSVALTGSWLAKLAGDSVRSAAELPSYFKSLERTLLDNFGEAAAARFTAPLRASWLLAVAGYAALAGRARPPRSPARSDALWLTDLCVLVLLPLPLSAFFQPHHGVALLPLCCLVMALAVDSGVPRWARCSAAALALSAAIAVQVVDDWPARGLALQAALALALGAAFAVRVGLQSAKLRSP